MNYDQKVKLFWVSLTLTTQKPVESLHIYNSLWLKATKKQESMKFQLPTLTLKNSGDWSSKLAPNSKLSSLHLLFHFSLPSILLQSLNFKVLSLFPPFSSLFKFEIPMVSLHFVCVCKF